MRERLPDRKGSAPLYRLGQALRCKRSFLGAVEKVLNSSLSYITDRVERKTTPPLRGSRRGRAVLRRPIRWGVFFKTRFIAIPNNTPHRIACGLAPLALRLPLKGGVNFKSVRATKIASTGFFNNPFSVAFGQRRLLRVRKGALRFAGVVGGGSSTIPTMDSLTIKRLFLEFTTRCR